MSKIVRDLLDRGAPLEEVERLLQQWGGVPLYVPRTVHAQHPIATIAGITVARVLSRLYGGERLVMPVGVALRRESLRRQVESLTEAGLSRTEVARRLGLHLRQVQRLGKSPRKDLLPPRRDDPQMDLDIPDIP
jgi:hypothetical protein